MYSVAASLHHRLENLNVCVGEEGANNHSSVSAWYDSWEISSGFFSWAPTLNYSFWRSHKSEFAGLS